MLRWYLMKYAAVGTNTANRIPKSRVPVGSIKGVGKVRVGMPSPIIGKARGFVAGLGVTKSKTGGSIASKMNTSA